MSSAPGHELVAVTIRNGIEESYHWGSVVALGPSGDVALAVGNPDLGIFGRSSNKPMQAAAMVRAGLRLPGPLLALVCASHSGTPAHLDGARAILDGAGLDGGALGNTADYPLDDESRRRIIEAGGGPTSLQMNCSGKHSGMLATCVACGWDADRSYLEVDHPLQQRITATIEELTGEPPRGIGVDGCGAPAHVTSLIGLARAFRTIALGGEGAFAQVFAAMTGDPFMVGGPGRDVTRFMEGIPCLMAKDGAEGVFAAALPDGRAIALKVADGGDRARPVLFGAALAALGVDVSGVADAWTVPVRGHGRRVGVVRPLGELAGFLPLDGEI